MLIFRYTLACHLQIDADPDPDPAYYFVANTDPGDHLDPDPDPTFQFDADPCGSGSTTLGRGASNADQFYLGNLGNNIQ
jgi:hypothetical protein